MSYQRLAGFGDSNEECLAKGLDAVKPIMQKVVNLRAHWHPTGYYTPRELLANTTRIFDELAAARKAITSVLNGDNGDQVVKLADKIGDAQADLIPYIRAAQNAKPDALVEAPGFRDVAINAFYQVAYVTGAAVFIDCNSWPLTLIRDIAQKWTAFGDAIAEIAGEIFDVAKEIVKIPGNLGKILASVVKIAAVGGAVYIVYELFGKPKRGGARR